MKSRKNIKLSQKNKGWLSSRKTAWTWTILGLFAITCVLFTIQTATSGARLSLLEKEETEISEKNQILERELIYLNSLSNLEEGAESLGFVEPQKIMYISEDEIVAKVP